MYKESKPKADIDVVVQLPRLNNLGDLVNIMYTKVAVLFLCAMYRHHAVAFTALQ